MFIKNFKELKEAVTKLKPMKVVVAAAEDERVIGGIKLAKELGIVKSPILTGEFRKIKEIIESLGEDLNQYDIRKSSDDSEAARLAVSAINDGEAQILVKGRLETVYYLKAILDKENGIRASKVLSNLTMFEMESYHKFIAVTDNAIIPFPTLLEKKVIIEKEVIPNEVIITLLTEVRDLKSDLEMLKEAIVEILNKSLQSDKLFKEKLTSNSNQGRKKIILNRDESGKIISAETVDIKEGE